MGASGGFAPFCCLMLRRGADITQLSYSLAALLLLEGEQKCVVGTIKGTAAHTPTHCNSPPPHHPLPPQRWMPCRRAGLLWPTSKFSPVYRMRPSRLFVPPSSPIVSATHHRSLQAFSFWSCQNVGGHRGDPNSYEKEQVHPCHRPAELHSLLTPARSCRKLFPR